MVTFGCLPELQSDDSGALRNPQWYWFKIPHYFCLSTYSGMGKTRSADPEGRRDLDASWSEALAWRHDDHGNDAYRHSGAARRQGRRMDGKGQRRTIPQVTRTCIHLE